MGQSSLSRFLIFCQDKEDVTRVKADIAMQPGCIVDTSENSEWTAKTIAGGEVKCLIFNCKSFNLGSMKTVNVLRAAKPRMPVIVIAAKIEKDVLEFGNQVRYVVLIERKQYNYGVIFDLCTKVRQDKPVYRRSHERFMTSQPVEIERVTDHKLFSGTMSNMSRGGAFLDVNGVVADGDILKVTVTLPEVKKAHVVFGEVVRLIVDGYPKGQCGAGIRYISPQDLYNILLERS